MRSNRLWATGLVSVITVGGVMNAASAQVTKIIPDTAAGVSLGTTVVKSGTTYTIGGGTVQGTNLFQSFSHFDLGMGYTANWVRSSGDASAITNVVNRVTDGTPSSIRGTMQSTGLPNASFYFINPAGIVFGYGARVNVPGAAHFSTAQEIHFADDAVFSAATPSGSVLTTANPAAFGFLGGQGDIKISNLISGTYGVLAALGSKTTKLDLVGGDVNISYSEISAGQFDVMAVGHDKLNVAIQDRSASTYKTFTGNLTLVQSYVATGASNATSPWAGGNMVFAAKTINVQDSNIVSQSYTSRPGGIVTIAAAGDATMDGAMIGSSSEDTGEGGGVNLDIGGNLLLENSAELASYTDGDHKAGNLSVKVGGNLAITSGSVIESFTDGTAANSGAAGDIAVDVAGDISLFQLGIINSASYGPGAASRVQISGRNLSLDTTSEISSTVHGLGSGNTVTLNISDTVTLTNRSAIETGTDGSYSSGAGGNAGDINIFAKNVVLGDASGTASMISTASDGLSGNAGNIAFNLSGNLIVNNNNAIWATTKGAGGAGSITAAAASVLVDGGALTTDSFSSTGTAGRIGVSAIGALTIRNGGLLSSGTAGTGNSGLIDIRAATLLMDNGAITAASAAGASGDAGSISVTVADLLTMANHSVIQSSTKGSGAAGSITIAAKNGAMSDSSYIEARSEGPGKAGTVAISVAGDFSLVRDAFIMTDAIAGGAGGDVHVATLGHLILASDAMISSASHGAGNAGQVDIAARDLLIDDAGVSVDSYSTGRAGSATVKVAGIVVLQNGGMIIADSEKSAAGSISIDAGAVWVTGVGSTITSNDDSLAGNGTGSITISSSLITLSDGGAITTNAAGPAGAIALVLPKTGVLIMEGLTPGRITTNSSANSGGRITISDPLAIIMNGATIQAIGPTPLANAALRATAIIQSSQLLNNINVAGSLALDTQVIDVGADVTIPNLGFGDPFGVVSGQCAAQLSGAGVSHLAIVPTGPNGVPGRSAEKQANASQGIVDCATLNRPQPIAAAPSHALVFDKVAASGPAAGTIDTVAVRSYKHARRRPAANGFDVAGFQPAVYLVPSSESRYWHPAAFVRTASPRLKLAQNAITPRTGPKAGTAVPEFAKPRSDVMPQQPALQAPAAPVVTNFVVKDVVVTADVSPFLAHASRAKKYGTEPGVTIDVKNGEILDSRWVSAQFARNGLVGSEVSADRILQLVLLINRAYVENGYINTGIRLRNPALDESGRLQLDLIAGRALANGAGQVVNVTWGPNGSRGLGERYVRDRLQSAHAIPLNAFDLERDFRRLADDPAVITANADLRPGGHPGEATLAVIVNPARRFDVYIAAANNRSPATGAYRAVAGGLVRNLVLSGDTLSGEFGSTQGLLDATLGYSTPVVLPDLSFEARGQVDRAAVVDPNLKALQIRSKEASFEGGFSYRLLQTPLMPSEELNTWTPAQSMSVGFRLGHTVSTSTLLGVPFSFTPGAVNGQTHFTVLRGLIDWSRRDTDNVLGIAATATLGLEGTGSDVVGVARPDPNFFALNLRADYALRLTENDLQLHLRAAGQWASSLLYSEERFSVGGEGTINGYRQNVVLADKGLLAGVELSCPVRFDALPCTREARKDNTLRAALFTSGAYAANDARPQPDPKWLGSIGVSLTWTPVEGVVAKVSYAKALVAAPIAGDHSLQDDGLDFRVTFHPLEVMNWSR